MKRIVLAWSLVAAIIPLASLAAPLEAPFGLTWNMSTATLAQLGFTAMPSSKGPIKTYSSVSVPKAWSGAEVYLALVYQDHLIKVVAVGKDIQNDIAGVEGKKAYQHIQTILTEKYGKPSVDRDDSGRKLYKDFDEFYQCLAYTGCGLYVTLYDVDGGNVALQLNGKTRGVGYMSLQYESPAFAAAKKEVAQKDTNSDSSAL